jgi:uncharacterized membrane protein YgcG
MKKTIPPHLISALLMSTGVASAATRQYEGTVVSVNRDAKTFRLHDSERGTIRIKVRSSTRFERINGFASLRRASSASRPPSSARTGAGSRCRSKRSGGGGSHGGHGGRDD